MSVTNQKWILKERPNGLVKKSDFDLIEEEITDIKSGEILVKNSYLSFDPTQRMWLTDLPGYLPPVQIDEVVRAGGVGEVIESKNDDYKVGDLVMGLVGWQQYCVSSCKPEERLRIVPNIVPMPTLLNVLGTTGITAYYGLVELGKPKKGETVLISGAAGATGSVAAQIAKIHGCKVIGIAGGEKKCGWLKEECGIDHVIDYKNSDVKVELPKIATEGIDIYFDNVGGPLLEDVIWYININARILLCGAISSYTSNDISPGPMNLFNLIIKRATIQGFLVLDYLPKAENAINDISAWLMEGKLKHIEDIQEGLENCPDTLNRLFTGKNYGKQLLKI